MSSLSCSFSFLLYYYYFSWLVSLLLCRLCLFVLYVILALWPPLAARFAFLFVLIVLFLLFVVVLSSEPKQNQGRELVDRKLVQAPSNFVAGRPNAALLFWFFGDFRYCVLLFIVILARYKYRNR